MTHHPRDALHTQASNTKDPWRSRRGSRAYHAGRAAEASVAREYRRRGAIVAAERWRGKGGEIDLVVRDGEGLVFVEVKSGRSFAEAAFRLGRAQVMRIARAAAEFMGREPGGLNMQARFDLALVDGTGRVSIVENAWHL